MCNRKVKTMDVIRLIDLGFVTPIRSQTIYHAVAYALDEHTPDTIIIVAPDKPYVCIGFHQELEKEIDVKYCNKKHLPIVRREVGGGAVYLDKNQVFLQWVFHRDALPHDINERFALYVKPLVKTYHALGIPANYRPINDIHVGGKKIGGTGAAQMGMAEVVVGSLMFDFDFDVMPHVLNVSSEKMRDKISQSLNEYMTTMTRQLGYTPDRDATIKIYLKQAQTILGRRIVDDRPTNRELALAEKLDEKFATIGWLYQKGSLRQSGVKIHQDINVREVALKTSGGLVRVTARVHDGRIDDMTLSGDFTMLPKFATDMLEQAMRGVSLEVNAIRTLIEDMYRNNCIASPGLTTDDLTNAIMLLSQQ
jgi:lipoate-protein ligase A